MSSRDWILEPETGRYYIPWLDEHGRSIRRYSEELNPGTSSSSQPSSHQTYQSTPRYEKKPTYIAYGGPTKHSSAHKHRRDQDQTQPITIRSGSSTTYHGEGSAYHDSASYGSPPDSRAPQPSGSHADSRDYQRVPYVDPLTSGMGALTVQESVEEAVGRDPYYQPIAASAPTQPGQWSSMSSVPPSGHTVPHDNRAAQGQWSSSALPSEDVGSYKGKGKATGQDLAQQQAMSQRYVGGTDGLIEKLDKSYRVRNTDYKTFFRTGRVFSTLHTDTYSEATTSENDQWRTVAYEVRYGEKVHCKIRRFVVVRQGDRSCTCLPITTYDGKGYLKRGIHLDEHGLVYSDKRPRPVDGINKEPLKIKISKGGSHIGVSYINFARVYTVETNVKVKDVGELDTDSRRNLRQYFREVIVPSDDSDPDPELPPQARAIQFEGIGSGLAGAQHEYASQPHTAYGPSRVSSAAMPSGSNYSSSSGYPAPSYSSRGFSSAAPVDHVADSAYYPAAGSASQPLIPSISYSAQPGFDPRQSSSSVSHHTPDVYSSHRPTGAGPGYTTSDHSPHVSYGSGPVDSHPSGSHAPVSSAAHPEDFQPQQPAGDADQYSSSGLPAGREYSGEDYQSTNTQQDDIVLPSLEESRAHPSRHRRESNASRTGQSGRSNPDSRRRNRDGDREYDRNQDRGREGERRRK